MSRVLAVINFLSRSGHPDQGLPEGEGPVDPGYGIGVERPGHLPSFGGPVDPGYGVPLPPVVDNGLPGMGGHPDQGLPPTYPVYPDQGLPSVPGVWPKPPLGIWPPPQPVYPSHPIYPTSPGTPDQGLPGQPGKPTHPIELPPGSVWPPLPPEVGGKILAFCWLVGIGYRWVVIDPSLKPGFPSNPGEHPDQGLPPVHGRPDQGLPPTAQPKR